MDTRVVGARLDVLRSAVLSAVHLPSSGSIARPATVIEVPRVRSRLARFVWVYLAFAVATALIATEIRTSWIQARALSWLAKRMSFYVVSGSGSPPAIRHSGPQDIRFGYTQLPTALDNLRLAGFEISSHTELSRFERLGISAGLPPIYRDKTQTGLRILDDKGRVVYQAAMPRRIYPDYDSIPPVVVQSLLFAGNRAILDASTPDRNPAVEWDRLARAAFDVGLHRVDRAHPVTGGSTLATQLEKMRHSEDGRTASLGDKFRQMLAASLRAYQDGPENFDARKRIVCDYINSLPLAATPAQGEVAGLNDGLSAWFGVNADEANRLLVLSDDQAIAMGKMEGKAMVYREALTLLLAAKKPSEFLGVNPNALNRRVEAYLNLLAAHGVISGRLREEALRIR